MSQLIRTPVQAHPRSAVSLPAKWEDKGQHCIHASQLVRTPVQAHPRGAVSLPAKWEDKCTRTALYPCQPNGKNTRSSAPAQHCIHASKNGRNICSSAPGQHCILPAKWQEHLFKPAWTALYPCQPNLNRTRSAASLPAKW